MSYFLFFFLGLGIVVTVNLSVKFGFENGRDECNCSFGLLPTVLG